LTFQDFIGQADQGTGLTNASGFLAFVGPSNSPPGLIDPEYATDMEMAPLVDAAIGKLTVTGTQLGTSSGSALIATGQTTANYLAGIACFSSSTQSPANTVTDFWSVPLTFTTSSTDPSGFVWTPGTSTGTGATTTTTTSASTTTTTTLAGGSTTTTAGSSSTATHLVVTGPSTATAGTAFSHRERRGCQ